MSADGSRPAKAARPDDGDTAVAAAAAPRGRDVDSAVPGLLVRRRDNPVVFLDLAIGGRALPRLKIELFAHIVPRTAENFRQLCTGEATRAGQQAPPGYKSTTIHRVVRDFVLQGGDFVSGDGRGSWSIYGDTFADEGFTVSHDASGLLSSANSGRDRNGCQFLITLAPLPGLDGKHVVFGRVLEGMEAVRECAAVPTFPSAPEKPSTPITIAECGEL